MRPNMAVDAPTLNESGLNTHENRMPPKEDMKYKVVNFQKPNPFSSPDPMTMVEIKFKARCMKLACKNTGVMNRQTWFRFLIFRASFHPSVSSALGFGARNSVFTMR